MPTFICTTQVLSVGSISAAHCIKKINLNPVMDFIAMDSPKEFTFYTL